MLRATGGAGCMLMIAGAVIITCGLAVFLWWLLLTYGPGL